MGRAKSAIGLRAMARDITYIRTQEGFVYLAVVIDLFSRRLVALSLQAFNLPRLGYNLFGQISFSS